MQNKPLLLIVLMATTIWSQQVEPKPLEQPKAMESSMDAKTMHKYFYYTGLGLTGLGVLTLGIAAHYDGLATDERDRANIIYQERMNSAEYSRAYKRTNDLGDTRDVLFITSGSLLLLGAGLLTFDYFHGERFFINTSPNGIQASVRF